LGGISLKKHFRYALSILAGVAVGIVISSALYVMTGFSLFGESNENPASYGEMDNAKLAELAFDTLELIRDGDYAALSRVAHPEYGVVFSPCATVSLPTNKCFSAEQIAAFGADSNVYVWGVYSVGGEPIEMTAGGYFSEFVFDRDYTAASVVGVNRVVRSGNALENITDVFPDVLFVDFHIPGDEKDNAEEPDWSSLRLGFEDFDGRLRLTVILHSERTV
jgi:hypothetical protein